MAGRGRGFPWRRRPLGRAEIPDDRHARVDADPHVIRRRPCVTDCHHGVADEFVDRPAFAMDGLDGQRQEVGEMRVASAIASASRSSSF
jgi:hypothetical protein